MNLGVRVQALRKKHGFTQEEMASLLGIKRSGYGHIENGRVEVSATALALLATKLKTTPNYLLGFTDNSPYEDWIVDIVQSPMHEVKALKEIWESIKRLQSTYL